jgi:hypothetical protein
MDDGDDTRGISIPSIGQAVGIALQEDEPMEIVAQRKYRGMGSDEFDGLIESRLESLRRSGTSFEIPGQGVPILRFCLGMDRDLSHLTDLPSVAEPALGPQATE